MLLVACAAAIRCLLAGLVASQWVVRGRTGAATSSLSVSSVQDHYERGNTTATLQSSYYSSSFLSGLGCSCTCMFALAFAEVIMAMTHSNVGGPLT